MPSSLFGDESVSGSPAPSTDSGPVASTSKATSSSSTGGLPSFVPRALKKRPGAPRPSVSNLSGQSIQATLPSARPVVEDSTPLRDPPRSHSPQEIQRLEQLLTVIESSFSNHGLTSYRSSGLLEKFKSGVEWIHLSQVLSIVPVRALTSKLVDLKNAVQLRSSNIIKVHETGYQIGRKDSDVAGLEDFELADWDDLSIHLDHVPFNTSLNSIIPSQPQSFSLVDFLSSALETPIQKLVLPALYDPKNPLDLDQEEEEDEEEGEGQTSQAEAFKASMKSRAEEEGVAGNGTMEVKRTAKGLPRGGGPFKGFAFIVVKDREVVEKILKEWNGVQEGSSGAANEDEEDEEEDVKMDGAEEGNSETKTVGKGKGKGKGKAHVEPREKAKRGGMKAMPYSRWLELKKEYLSYRRTLERLLEAQARGELDQLRNPPDTKDRPPHLQHSADPANAETSFSKPTQRSKRASSPSFNHDSSASNSNQKRIKRASSPSTLIGTPLTRHTRKLRTPSPIDSASTGAGNRLDLTSDVALSIQGAYPEGCVLWVRNVFEKSSKTSLKSLFGKLLDELQEGSGKGVEFVDYEKGLETCYIRFSSAPLAALTESHLLSTITYHLSQHTLSSVDSLSHEELSNAQKDLRRPMAVELLRGEQERHYWASLPESTRKAARLGAGGKVGLVKEPRGFAGTYGGGEDQGGQGGASNNGNSGSGNGSGDSSRKRKKPSRM